MTFLGFVPAIKQVTAGIKTKPTSKSSVLRYLRSILSFKISEEPLKRNLTASDRTIDKMVIAASAATKEKPTVFAADLTFFLSVCVFK